MVKAQSSVEFMLILAAVMVLSIIALGSASGHLGNAGEFARNATNALGNSSFAFLSGISAGGSTPYVPPDSESGDAYPELGIEIYARTLYVGEPSIIQTTIWNYGGVSATVAGLEIFSSDETRLGISPSSHGGFKVGISHTTSSLVTPVAPGTYSVSATAYGEDGQPLRSANGSIVSANASVLVLSPGGWIPEKPPGEYNITFIREDERIAYSVGQPEVVRGGRAVIRPPVSGMEGNWACPCAGSRAWFAYWDYSSGNADLSCVCVSYFNSANASMIGTVPEARFRLSAEVSNATGSAYSCELSGNSTECEFSEGDVSLSGSAAATGPSPASDSVSVAEAGNSTWMLRPLSAYNSYRSSFNTLDAALSTINGNIYCRSVNCNGIMDILLATENLRKEFLNSTSQSSSACAANATLVSCNPASFEYPTVLFRLDSSFAGGEIPAPNPDKFTVSGIDVEVSTR